MSQSCPAPHRVVTELDKGRRVVEVQGLEEVDRRVFGAVLGAAVAKEVDPVQLSMVPISLPPPLDRVEHGRVMR